MKKGLIIIMVLALMAGTASAANLLPIQTEVFQEISIDDAGKAPEGAASLTSIEVEPIDEYSVKYIIKFDSKAKDGKVPLAERYAYQDLESIQMLDFYNCYMSGTLDGIAIRRDPVTAVDTKLFKARKDETYVLRVIFFCAQGTKVEITPGETEVTLLFGAERGVMDQAKAGLSEKDKKDARRKKGSAFVKVHKGILFGVTTTALAGAAAAYFIGHDKGETIGREDGINNPPSRLPDNPSEDEYLPPSDYWN